jgi:hypothetical protein
LWIVGLDRTKLRACGVGQRVSIGRAAGRILMSRFKLVDLLVLVFCIVALPLHAQDAPKTQKNQEPTATQSAPAPPPPAKPADVASPDAILAATYQVISGPAAEKRDWDRFRSLFAPGARLIAVSARKTGTGLEIHGVTPVEYATYADAYFQKNGFAEREIARKSERYGNIMQIFSTYESRHDAGDAQPFARGINSFQLFYDGTRWWVVTIFWQEEAPDTPLPKEFLPAAK